MRRVLNFVKALLQRLRNLTTLKEMDFEVMFPHDGDVVVRLPSVSYKDLCSQEGRLRIFHSAEFVLRAGKEPLLRRVVRDLYSTGYLEADKPLIDIGCWIGDNAVVWAKARKHAVVYAVEPLRTAFDFADSVAVENSTSNISFTNAVCSDAAGQTLAMNMNSAGTSFEPAAKRDEREIIISTSLDEVIPKDDHRNIQLIHVDVEGMEHRVLTGALKILSLARPAILFEQHICRQDISIIVDILRPLNYAIYMINETLPGNDPDCRNFLAIDASRDLPIIMERHINFESGTPIWSAVVGPSLIEVDHE